MASCAWHTLGAGQVLHSEGVDGGAVSARPRRARGLIVWLSFAAEIRKAVLRRTAAPAGMQVSR